MAAKISTSTELFHRFHTCELYVKQGKIATCLIAFKNIIESLKGVPLTEKEKEEIHQGIEGFLKNLSLHKKFQEIFGEVKFGDTDLETNLEFMKSMIVAQEEEIVEKVAKDEEAAEAQRIDAEKIALKKKEEDDQKIADAVKLIEENNLPEAQKTIGTSEAIRDGVILHFNEKGIAARAEKKFTEAVQCYTRALSVSPRDENLHYNVGRALFEEGDSVKAEEYLAKALNINPEFKEGKLFHEYLLKVKHTKETAGDNVKKDGGFFKKIFSFKK
ncbi:MAG TPA: tetratricopeptide repeat protein [Smithellaceae bacterium]|nr:tetratricopeptide repeat protein [Smithellaceae bacterium]